MTCRVCEPHQYFRNMSTLRKHYCKVHRDRFLATQKKRVANMKGLRVVHVAQEVIKKDLKVSEVLEKLEGQKVFISDVIALLRGFMS